MPRLHLHDADGNSYVDLVSSWGPMILGHAHPAVVEAVQRAASTGLSFGRRPRPRSSFAEELIARVDPVEQVRLVNSGTEATMSAIWLARGFTGRGKIIKFSGCYHGHVDALLADAGSGSPPSDCRPRRRDRRVRSRHGGAARTTTWPPSQPRSTSTTVRSPRSSPRQPPATWARWHLSTASMPACANSPSHGALLIMDEVMTGFRVSLAGWYGLEGVAGDLYTFGKVMSGGLPAAAFGPPRDHGSFGAVGAGISGGHAVGEPGGRRLV